MVIVSKPVFKSFEVQTEGRFQTIRTGQKIRFVIEESGEEKTGILLNIKGKKEDKTKVIIKPDDDICESTYDVMVMAEDSLKVAKDE
jgi:hypothetical protein